MSLGGPDLDLGEVGPTLRYLPQAVCEVLCPLFECRLQIGPTVGTLEVSVAKSRRAFRTAFDVLEAVEDQVDLILGSQNKSSNLVGALGFEPRASTSQTWRANRTALRPDGQRLNNSIGAVLNEGQGIAAIGQP